MASRRLPRGFGRLLEVKMQGGKGGGEESFIRRGIEFYFCLRYVSISLSRFSAFSFSLSSLLVFPEFPFSSVLPYYPLHPLPLLSLIPPSSSPSALPYSPFILSFCSPLFPLHPLSLYFSLILLLFNSTPPTPIPQSPISSLPPPSSAPPLPRSPHTFRWLSPL